MDDLIEKFFREDLSEAEKEALGKNLASSDEAARRFGEKAEQAYGSFGLPEPRWTGAETLRPKPGPGFGEWLSLFLFAAALAGGVAWICVHLMKKPPELSKLKKPVPLAQSTSSYSSQAAPQNEMTASASNRPLTTAQALPLERGSSPLSQVQPPLPATQAASAKATLPPLGPKFTPVNLDQNPNQTFSSLAVQLHLSSPRALAVRVLDGQGNELLPLFNGALNAGTWAFQWNGLLKDGRVAPPGRYEIQVKAGSWVQTKEIVIPK
jgi:hypothetical protein